MTHHAQRRMPVYSDLFVCLHDEAEPVGQLGRGTHYSVLRCTESLAPTGEPYGQPQAHDFAVVWDEDHDTRVIEAIEKLYASGLLSPVLFIGERKGVLSIILSTEFYRRAKEEAYADYIKRVENLVHDSADGDEWSVELGYYNGDADGPIDAARIVHAPPHRVEAYLKHIDALWNLGHEPLSKKLSTGPLAVSWVTGNNAPAG